MRKMLLLGFVIVLAGYDVAAQGTDTAVDLVLTVSNDVGDARDLHFGLDPAATDGLDTALGEAELPPLPPGEVFEARFIGDDISLAEQLGQGSYRDYRAGGAGFTGEVTHELRLQRGSGSTITLGWMLPAGVTGRLQDLFDGVVVDEVMSGTGSYEVTNTALDKLKLVLTYSGSVSAEPEGVLPEAVVLHQNYPNPFNPRTTIAYSVPAPQHVRVQVLDALGREVATLVDGLRPAGTHQVTFDAEALSSGLFIYRIEAGGVSTSRAMLLLK